MAIEVCSSDDPAEVMERAGDFLRTEPVRHNLILSLLAARIGRPEPGRFWIVADDGVPVGVVLQSPTDFAATVTPMPLAAVDAAVRTIVEQGVELPGVNGEAATTARFAGQWTELRGSAARPEMGMRLYELVDLVEPAGVTGTLRPAAGDDAEVVAAMVEGFHADTGERAHHAVDDWVRLRIQRGEVWLWDDSGPVAMAAHTDPVAGSIRIQAVYTPPEHRCRGYGGSVVAGLSRRLLDEGARVLLFTDLGNPTSNSVYRRIGFRAVDENLRYVFEG
jgi:uncharacterized protein